MKERVIYMSSFYPIVFNRAGKKAVAKFDLPPYIDGSCRREPDFDNEFPAVTGLCRPGFAAKLEVGDLVIYCTNKRGIGSRKVGAVLEVIHLEATHNAAAAWYNQQGHSLPNNIMVKNNPPIPLDKTHNIKGWDNWVDNKDLQSWDKQYVERASQHPKVAICKPLYKNTNTPFELRDDKLVEIFGKVPGTQNPSVITEQQWENLKKYFFI